MWQAAILVVSHWKLRARRECLCYLLTDYHLEVARG